MSAPPPDAASSKAAIVDALLATQAAAFPEATAKQLGLMEGRLSGKIELIISLERMAKDMRIEAFRSFRREMKEAGKSDKLTDQMCTHVQTEYDAMHAQVMKRKNKAAIYSD
jgi:hypothetical protein